MRWPIDVLESYRPGALDWNIGLDTDNVHTEQDESLGNGISEEVKLSFSRIKIKVRVGVE